MTDEELKEYRAKILEDCKKYSRIDYEDDDDILELMIDTTLEEMSELIPTFNSENLSSRQRLLLLVSGCLCLFSNPFVDVRHDIGCCVLKKFGGEF